MARFRLKIEYDGTSYHGWQKQKNAKTVQETIEKALIPLNKGKRVVVHGSGRTDSGVHALAQIAHFDLSTGLESDTIKNAINARTPRDIVIHNCDKVDPDFHARFAARKRYYMYKIHQGNTAIKRNYVWPVDHFLELDLLEKCAKMVKGDHDFEGFCRSSDEADHKKCRIYKSTWKIHKKTLIYKICGNRFLHSMVRMLTGTMIEVARGRYKLEDFSNILENKNISKRVDPFTAPAKGLYLEKVEY